MKLTVGDGMVNESNEASSPPLRTVLADDCIVWDRRQSGGGGKFSFLDACNEDVVFVEEFEELWEGVDDSVDIDLEEVATGLGRWRVG